MKLTKLIEPKQLLPLSLLVAPVAGEMVINSEGLPSPWIFSLITPLISLYSLNTLYKRFTSDIFAGRRLDTDINEVALNKKDIAIIIYSVIRNCAGLIGSWTSLGIHGLSGFQYLELSWLNVFSIYDFLERDRVERIHSWSANPRHSSNSWKIFANLTFATLFATYLWNIVSLGIYGSLKNFPKSAQFLTNCTEIPTTSWHTISQCTPTENGFGCFLGIKNIWIVDLFIRVLGIIIPIIFACLTNYGADREDRQRKSKLRSKLLNILVLIITAFYLISMASIQAKGLNTTGLENCDINPSLLSSKTGYLVEWFFQSLTALKQIALI